MKKQFAFLTLLRYGHNDAITTEKLIVEFNITQ